MQGKHRINNMGFKISHIAGAFIIMAIVIGLFFTIYKGFQENYGFNVQVTKFNEDNTTITSNRTIIQDLEELNIFSAMNESVIMPSENISFSLGSLIDITGSLINTGIGLLNVVWKTATLPFRLYGVIHAYYPTIANAFMGIVVLFLSYLGYVFVSAYLGRDT